MKKSALALLPFCAALAACDERSSSDQKMNLAQEQLSEEAAMEVGMPSITNFQEKRMLKSVVEARDRTIATTAYIQSMTGQLFKLCDAVGYGIPYATQYTNPQKIEKYSGYSPFPMPQADPNGLFSPPSADGTWVFCLDPEAHKDKPVYVEPRVIVSPFPLKLKPVDFDK